MLKVSNERVVYRSYDYKNKTGKIDKNFRKNFFH